MDLRTKLDNLAVAYIGNNDVISSACSQARDEIGKLRKREIELQAEVDRLRSKLMQIGRISDTA